MVGSCIATPRGSAFPVYVSCAMAITAHSKPFVVTRNKCIEPKQRRIERLPSGYAVREFYNNPRGHYWYVITALAGGGQTPAGTAGV
jgi:hypothetical protein